MCHRKKTLKPPGGVGKKPAPIKVAGKAKAVAKAAEESSLSPSTRAAIKAAKDADAIELAAPTLRRSTMQRVEEAEKERQQAEKLVSSLVGIGVLVALAPQLWMM